MVRGQVTVAGTVRAGDSLGQGDHFVVVEKVRRAQGRKPSTGENLHFVTSTGEVVKLNSMQPVRIVRAG